MTTRRTFLNAAPLILAPRLVRGTAANSAVRLGLLGCGGRGTGVAAGFMQHAGARVTALGDMFPDQLERAKSRLDAAAAKLGHGRIDGSNLFRGPEAYRQLFASGAIDAVYIATPVWFHPQHLEAAVEAGKHVYVEKPVAVDPPGVRRALAAAARAKGKLSVTIGLQLRHATPYVELVKRVHEGALGEVVCGLIHYYASALTERKDIRYTDGPQGRLRNWLIDRALSGDIIVEQNVHIIDFANWLLRAHPVRATGTRGRKARTDPGDCSSHYNLVYEYPGGLHVNFASTQFIKGAWDVAMRFFGSAGNSEARYDTPVVITGDHAWEFPGLGPRGQITDHQAAITGAFKGALDDSDAQKQRAFITSITSGRYLNDVPYAADSTLSAIMGRTAAATGRPITWEETLRSNETIDPKLEGIKVG